MVDHVATIINAVESTNKATNITSHKPDTKQLPLDDVDESL
jgi:hypothetical protein